jgi:hypothetical protein
MPPKAPPPDVTGLRPAYGPESGGDNVREQTTDTGSTHCRPPLATTSLAVMRADGWHHCSQNCPRLATDWFTLSLLLARASRANQLLRALVTWASVVSVTHTHTHTTYRLFLLCSHPRVAGVPTAALQVSTHLSPDVSLPHPWPSFLLQHPLVQSCSATV